MDVQLERWRQNPVHKYQVVLTGQLNDAWKAYEHKNPDQKFSTFVRSCLREALVNYITNEPIK